MRSLKKVLLTEYMSIGIPCSFAEAPCDNALHEHEDGYQRLTVLYDLCDSEDGKS